MSTLTAPRRIQLRKLILDGIPPEDPWPRLKEIISLSGVPRRHRIRWTDDAASMVLSLIRHAEAAGVDAEGVSGLQHLVEAIVGLGTYEPQQLEAIYDLIALKPSSQAVPPQRERLTPDPARAATASGRRRALLVGIDAYDKLPQLKSCANDARAVSATLRDLGAFETREITGRVDAATLRTELATLANGLTSDDLALVLYAGHGCRDGNSAVLAPSDFTAPSDRQRCVPIDEVREMLRGPGKIVQLFDACHLGVPFTARAGTAETDDWTRAFVTHRPGWISIAGANVDEPALESRQLGHGLFTYYLLQGLRGAVGHRSGDHLLVDAMSVAGWVSFAMARDGSAQRPHVGSDVSGLLVLTALRIEQ